MKNASVCRFIGALFVGIFLSFVSAASAANILNYQGRVISGGTAFAGSGQFKFALVSVDGSTVYWKNDGTTDAAAPTASVPLTVTKGIFSVRLGDTSFSNMAAISSSVFSNTSMALRIWFNDGVKGFQQLSPDQAVSESALRIPQLISKSSDDGNIYFYGATAFGPYTASFPMLSTYSYYFSQTNYTQNTGSYGNHGLDSATVCIPLSKGHSKARLNFLNAHQSLYSSYRKNFWDPPYGFSTSIAGTLKVYLCYTDPTNGYGETEVFSKTGGTRNDSYYGWDDSTDSIDFTLSDPAKLYAVKIVFSVGINMSTGPYGSALFKVSNIGVNYDLP